MSKFTVLALAALAGLAACTPPPAAPVDPLVAPIVGKALSNDNGTITLNADGTMSGRIGENRDQRFAGSWTVRDGAFCRTITEPAEVLERIAATECQEVEIEGDEVTFISPTGRKSTWSF